MKNKIIKMLGSIKFWYAVILSLAFFSEQMGYIPNAVAKTLELFSLLGISVRLTDKAINKLK